MRIKHAVLFAALIALAATCFSGVALANNSGKVTPQFVTLPPHNLSHENPPASLATFSITYPQGTATFVGAKSNTTTSIPTFIIPVKIVVTGSGAGTFDPLANIGSGLSAVNQTIASPLFQNSQWTQGGTNLGNTQYEDAYTKGSLWQKAKTAANFHVILGQPTVEPEITLTCASGADCGTGSNPFGGGQTIAYFDINRVDPAVISAISADGITQVAVPIALMYNTYMISGSIGNCCIGGYHSTEGANQVYGVSTYMSSNGGPVIFSQDVGALSHELGEIYEDPFINNRGCGGLLEVGDPLESEPNYGLYNIPLGGYTYHIQDLVFFPYFWQTPSQAVNGWYTFQNESVSVCSRGQ